MSLLNKLKFIESGISTESFRKNLMAVNCIVKNHILKMESANGFIIKHVNIDTEIDDCKFLIDSESLKTAIKLAGKNIIQIFSDKITIGNIDINYQNDLQTDTVYPDLSGLTSLVFSSKEIELFGISLSHDQLNLALKHAPKDSSLKFCFSNKLSPIRILFADNDGDIDNDYKSFVMPIKTDIWN